MRDTEIPKEADIVIIGGGISGCGTAYYLAKGGFNVLIIEKRSIASGASGRMGSCFAQIDGRTFTQERVGKRLPWVRADLKVLEGLSDELGYDIEFLQFGSVDFSTSDEETELLKKITNIQKEAGDDIVEFLDREELIKYCPNLSKGVQGGKYTRTDGTVNPIKLSWSYAMAAYKRYNAKMLLHTKVEKIIFKGSKAIGVKTNRGEIRANKMVINCANAWSPEFAPEIPIFPVNNITSVTEPVPMVPLISWESTYEGRYGYGAQQKRGNIVIGSLPVRIPECVEEHFDESVSYEDLINHASVIESRFPLFKGVSIIRIWAGVFCMTPDRFPYIGPMPGYENYFLNTGYSAGLPYCPIGAKLTSEYILNNGKTSIPIDLARPERYYGMKFDLPKKYNYTILEETIDKWDL